MRFIFLLYYSSLLETLSTNSLAPTRQFDTPHHMAAKKKGTTSATSEDTTTMTTTTPSQDKVVATQANGTNSNDISVDTIANGQHEVNLLDLGICVEDIAAMRQIDAHLEEVRRTQQQALEVGPSEPHMITRAKGKGTMLSEVERQEQYNKLKEEELRCRAMQKKLQEQRLMLERMQAPPLLRETATTNPRQQAPPRVRPTIIPIEENSDRSKSDGEGHQQRTHQRSRYQHGPRTPLSEELEEVQWPHHLNLTVLPQFDGESDPKEFLLKYEATIEAVGGGTTCKAKALVLALRGQAQRWHTNIPSETILSWN
jgi:hypothetical protein